MSRISDSRKLRLNRYIPNLLHCVLSISVAKISVFLGLSSSYFDYEKALYVGRWKNMRAGSLFMDR